MEGGQAARNERDAVVRATCDTLAEEFRYILRSDLPLQLRNEARMTEPDSMLSTYLRRLAESLPKPIVLVIDEIDALVGDSLVAILRQIRSGYAERPKAFPQSIILCGVRDVRDYRIVLSNQDIVTGGSAFNIKAESLRLGNFTKEEIHELYMQHTQETGQVFDEACFPMIWEATEGQPWLVNALGREVTYKIRENRNRSYIDKPTAMEMSKSLRGVPIVGWYSAEKKDFRDHGEEMVINGDGITKNIKTNAYGFVPTNAEVWFQDFFETDENGYKVKRTYLMTYGYIWTG